MGANYRDLTRIDHWKLSRLLRAAGRSWPEVKKRLPPELARKLQAVVRYGVGGYVMLSKIELMKLEFALDPMWVHGLKLLVLTRITALEGKYTRLKGLRSVLPRMRKARGLTQEELAQISGLKQEEISDIEHGHITGRTARERAKKLWRYLKALNISDEEYLQVLSAVGRGFTVGVPWALGIGQAGPRPTS